MNGVAYEAVVDAGPHHDVLVKQWAGQRCARPFEVDRRGQISPVDRGGEDVGDRLENSVDETPLSCNEGSVSVGVIQERGEDLPEGMAGHADPEVGEGDREIGLQVATELCWSMGRNDCVDGVEQKAGLVGPVPVDRRASDSRFLGDAGGRDRTGPVLDELVDGGFENDLADSGCARILSFTCLWAHVVGLTLVDPCQSSYEMWLKLHLVARRYHRERRDDPRPKT